MILTNERGRITLSLTALIDKLHSCPASLYEQSSSISKLHSACCSIVDEIIVFTAILSSHFYQKAIYRSIYYLR